jgi:hypothetical protein
VQVRQSAVRDSHRSRSRLKTNELTYAALLDQMVTTRAHRPRHLQLTVGWRVELALHQLR